MAAEARDHISKPARIGRWKPRKWKPIYEEIICFALVTGASRDDVAKRFNITPQHVSNILNTEQADFLRNILVGRVRDKAIQQVEEDVIDFNERVKKLQSKAFERVETVINDDEIFEKAPFAMLEKSLKILSTKGGILEKADNNDRGGNISNTNINIMNQQNNNVMMTPETLKKINTGLDKALEVKEIHANVIPDSFDGK